MQDQTIQDQRLSELDDWQLQDSDQDIRGREVFSSLGTKLGTIRDMLVDIRRERVSAVVLDNGSLLPVEDLEIRENTVISHEPGAVRGVSATYYEARLSRPTR